MSERQKPSPSYAPVYAAALYPELAVIAREHGYALAVHGSLQRDFDLIAVPWVDEPRPPEDLIAAITKKFAVRVIGEPGDKPHGRQAWTLSIGFGECFVDLSFMPCIVGAQPLSKPSALKRIADQLNDGEGLGLEEIVKGEGFAGRLFTHDDRAQLKTIVSWVFTEEAELRALLTSKGNAE